jgi:quinol-cytochrome oxidoreductase complex cytochrome b subunit
MKTIKRFTNISRKVYESLGNYLSPSNFTYLWSFGSLALICLVLQIITGLFLSMYYTADIQLAFSSVEYINRELYYGWLWRYTHMTGASMFFLVVYLHIAKNIFYGSFTYPRQILWFSGVILFILMMATAFLGYVLPWGQMSLWGATVITNIFSAIPVIGMDFVIWLWGGMSVDNATLSRFYSLHFLLPFIIAAVAILHLVFLHEYGSNNPLGILSRTDSIPFYINYIIKDLYSVILLLLFIIGIVFFNSNYFGHPDNYIAGDFMVTPTQIVPEWYFLPLYAILRSVPSKLGGLLILIVVFMFFMFWPLLIGIFQIVRNSVFKPFNKLVMPLFFFNLVFLGWIGGQAVEPLYLLLGQIAISLYFFIFFFFFFTNIIEFYVVYWYNFKKC